MGERDAGVLALPPVPAATLHSVDGWLWEYLPRHELVLGGGTVLAARWEHRESTDVDLFAPPGAFDGAEWRMAALAAVVGERVRSGDLTDALVAKRHLRLTLDKPVGELTVFTGQDATAQPVAHDETAAGFAVHSVEEILTRKLRFRVHGLGDFTQRDFYDFAVAALVEPDVMARVLAAFDAEANQAVARELRQAPTGFAASRCWHPPIAAWRKALNCAVGARVLFADGVGTMAEYYRRHYDGPSR